MTQAPLPILVFSDLDGTLLDHHSYDWSPARPALTRVLTAGGGVVLATSKTAEEVVTLREEMGLSGWPAIVENGAGIMAAGAAPEQSDAYTRLRAALDALPGELRRGYRGFGDMSAQEVAETTGLPLAGAKAAKARQFSEPGVWLGDDARRAAFDAALSQQGITARMGGRFYTLSFGRTKADAMTEVMDALAPAHTIALGDAPNDVEMLQTADCGVIVVNPDAAPLPPLAGESDGRIIRTQKPGPSGWNVAVQQAMDNWNL